MTYKGHIKNGSVVLDEPIALPDGAEVKVELTPVQRPIPSPELLEGSTVVNHDLDFAIGSWVDDPEFDKAMEDQRKIDDFSDCPCSRFRC